MKKQFADYTWLAGNHGSSGSLWQGPDHLLVIEGKGFLLSVSEVYRRLDYKNIQTLTLTPTRRYIWMSVLLGVGALLFALLTWAAMDQEPYLPISLGLPAGLLSILLIIHLARGRTCACTLQTAVQILRLKPLSRLRLAQPVILQIETLCRQHQSGLPAVSGVPAAPATFPMDMPTIFAPVAGAKGVWTGSNWVLAAGALSTAWGLLMAGELFVDNALVTLLNIMVGVASVVMVIVALVRAFKQKVPAPLASTLWIGLAAHLASGIGIFALAMASTMISITDTTTRRILETNQRTSQNLFGNLPAFRFDQTAGWGWVIVGLGVVLMCCGAVQVVYGRRREVAPAAGPEPVPPLSAAPPPPLSTVDLVKRD